ncbi:MAG TPA: SDR family oxidoreductase [Anaerolineae bacterium]|nr:SDR family oxidoreductase [Anaerolineae bacterium]HQI85754.1 SDR family oxidoreductase [Anaerolineae bacterium]
MNLQGKTALVTGGAVRVGRAMTLALARGGANVVIHYNSSAGPAEEAVAEAHALGVEALPVAANLADPDAVGALIGAVEAAFGGVDILVNSASPFVRKALHETTLDDWHFVLGALLDGAFLLSQAFAPGMIARGDGVIVNILDQSAFAPSPAYLAHSVGKHGLLGLTRNLAVALAPAVRVNAIAPGPVLPPPDYTPEQNVRIAARTLLQRWGSPDDVVKALLYLIDADYVTGDVLFVDGGERWK